ncbi:uncharacterized protein LOC135924010 [Gordionus sp. m RMFG-2023]|uniref:uncharacterized protein LOC135924010 n=1 Tax=Gordionus sp. m RMFG-2023 TaxID=3053472 RepID=UPI0031FC06F6
MNKIIVDALATANLLETRSSQSFFLENRVICYADDIVLITKSLEETQNLISILNFFSFKVGLDINFDKTVIIPSSQAPLLNNLAVGGKLVKVVKSFKYLGVTIDNKGSKEEQKIRIQNARAAFYKFFKLWKAREISVFTRLRIFNSTIIPILFYGGVTWEITKTETRKLQTNSGCALSLENTDFSLSSIIFVYV